jgi:hypothetical protein
MRPSEPIADWAMRVLLRARVLLRMRVRVVRACFGRRLFNSPSSGVTTRPVHVVACDPKNESIVACPPLPVPPVVGHQGDFSLFFKS